MKRKLGLLLTLLILTTAASLNAQSSIAGVWNTGQDNTKIEVKEYDGRYEGRIVSSDNVDAKIGALILKDAISDDGEWKGKLYSPQRKKWFNAALNVEGAQLSIVVKSGWKSQTVKWTKD